MEGNFSNRVQDVIRLSREEALRLGHDYIGTEHLLLGVIREGEGIAVKILRNLGVDLYKLKKAIEDTVRTSGGTDRKSTRLNFSHGYISYAVFCLKKKKSIYTSKPPIRIILCTLR